MQGWQFELATFVPWQASGFELPLVYADLLGADGNPEMIGRPAPSFGLGAEGKALFWTDAKVLQADRPCPMGEIASWLALAPAGADLVVLGKTSANQVVLTRLTPNGQAAWQRADLPETVAKAKRAQLLSAGSELYLYSAAQPAGQGRTGQVSRIDLATGALTPVIEFAEMPPAAMWGLRDALYWVSYIEATHYWVRHNLRDGTRQQVAAESALQSELRQACGALPEGGALICSLRGELIWMDAAGKAMRRAALAGLARRDKGLAGGWG